MKALDLQGRNRILSAIPASHQSQILAHLEEIFLAPVQILYGQGEPLTHVYFPISSVISLLTVMEDGESVEVATIGNEGMVGLKLFCGISSDSAKAITQSPGLAYRMSVEVFNELAREEPVRTVIDRYLRALLGQVFLSGGCNRFHSVTERFARWLLMMQDRAGVDEFPFTQEFLAEILGVRRQSVAVMETTLEKAKFIRPGRGKVTILDRDGLESISCECYRRVKDEYEFSFGPDASKAALES
jgi:CRP-like cAMP-binding protein